jgi:AP-1 complex subunit mu
MEDEGITYLYIKHNNLFLLAVTDVNASPAMILLYLYQVVEVLVMYFKELEEESVRDNFVIVYELLDEMMDFGYPQSTDPTILQQYITQESHKLQTKEVVVPSAVTGAVNWRPEGLKYRKNEVFVDIVESINLLVASNGTLLRSEVLGSIKLTTHLTGMPELRLALNDRVQWDRSRAAGGAGKEGADTKAIEMEDVNFHQCVKQSRDQDRTISFVPPDGEFELMTYRLTNNVKPLIWIEAVVERHSHSRVEYMIKAKSQFKERSTANNVEIIVPVPPNADSPLFKASIGTCEYKPESDCVVWTIKQFQGGREFRMRAHFGLPSLTDDENPDKRPPISVKFQVPYLTMSGVQVKYLKVIEKSNYDTTPWIRYLTQSKDCLFRIA